MKKFIVIFLAVSMSLVFGYESYAQGSAMMKGEKKGSMDILPKDPIATASGTISGTSEEFTLSGAIKAAETGDGVHIIAHLENVPDPGKHGIHIHANGSCDDGGKAAGGHFNPDETEHGFLPEDGHEHAHPGDMGNIVIDEQGLGVLSIFLPGLSLTDGKYNVSGKAIILHAKEDDFGQPTGNAGARIGCGIINLDK